MRIERCSSCYFRWWRIVASVIVVALCSTETAMCDPFRHETVLPNVRIITSDAAVFTLWYGYDVASSSLAMQLSVLYTAWHVPGWMGLGLRLLPGVNHSTMGPADMLQVFVDPNATTSVCFTESFLVENESSVPDSGRRAGRSWDIYERYFNSSSKVLFASFIASPVDFWELSSDTVVTVEFLAAVADSTRFNGGGCQSATKHNMLAATSTLTLPGENFQLPPHNGCFFGASRPNDSESGCSVCFLRWRGMNCTTPCEENSFGCSLPQLVSHISVTLNGAISNFQQATFRSVVAAAVEINSTNVEVTSVDPGSVVVAFRFVGLHDNETQSKYAAFIRLVDAQDVMLLPLELISAVMVPQPIAPSTDSTVPTTAEETADTTATTTTQTEDETTSPSSNDTTSATPLTSSPPPSRPQKFSLSIIVLIVLLCVAGAAALIAGAVYLLQPTVNNNNNTAAEGSMPTTAGPLPGARPYAADEKCTVAMDNDGVAAIGTEESQQLPQLSSEGPLEDRLSRDEQHPQPIEKQNETEPPLEVMRRSQQHATNPGAIRTPSWPCSPKDQSAGPIFPAGSSPPAPPEEPPTAVLELRKKEIARQFVAHTPPIGPARGSPQQQRLHTSPRHTTADEGSSTNATPQKKDHALRKKCKGCGLVFGEAPEMCAVECRSHAALMEEQRIDHEARKEARRRVAEQLAAERAGANDEEVGDASLRV